MGRDGTTWQLFLDESGDFDDDTQPVCVAGLLLQEPDTAGLDARLRDGLALAAPLAAYPWHTAPANLRSFHLAGWILANDAARGRQIALDAGIAPTMERAAFALRALRTASPAAAAFLQSTDAGRIPRYEDLRACDDLLKAREPQLASQLATLRANTLDRIRALLTAFTTGYTDSRCALLAAVDIPSPSIPVPPRADRYLALLGTLFERVFATLRARPVSRHTLWVRAAIRDVSRPQLGPVPMQSADVARAIRAAEAFPLDPPATPPDLAVRLVPDAPAEYRQHVHAGIVLADFVSNQVWNELRSSVQSARSPSWDELSRQLRRRTSLPTLLPVAATTPHARPGPTIAGAGTAQRAVVRAFTKPRGAEASRAAREMVRAVRPVWLREQAQRWIEIAAEVP